MPRTTSMTTADQNNSADKDKQEKVVAPKDQPDLVLGLGGNSINMENSIKEAISGAGARPFGNKTGQDFVNESRNRAATDKRILSKTSTVANHYETETTNKYRVAASMLSVPNPRKVGLEAVGETFDTNLLIRDDIVSAAVLGTGLKRFLKVGAVEAYYGPELPIEPEEATRYLESEMEAEALEV
jgi:hypothetical protein